MSILSKREEVEQAIALAGADWEDQLTPIARRLNVSPAYVATVKAYLDAVTFDDAKAAKELGRALMSPGRYREPR